MKKMMDKKGSVAMLPVIIIVILGFALVAAVIIGFRLDSLMTVFNRGTDLSPVEVEEDNMFNLIKEYLNLGQYEDASDLATEFLVKFDESTRVDEVKYLKFYALAKYDQASAYRYVRGLVSDNTTKVDDMLSMDYPLESGASSVAKQAQQYAEDATWNFYDGIKEDLDGKKDKAKESFKKNFKYTQVHSQVYLNFPLFNVFLYRVENNKQYPYIIKRISKMSKFAYVVVSDCKELSPLVTSYIDWLSGVMMVSTPISGSTYHVEYEDLKAECPGVYQALCDAYEAEISILSDSSAKTFAGRMQEFDSKVYNNCTPTSVSTRVVISQCDDNADNDNDGATDYGYDFSCSDKTDNDELNPIPECDDGADNDGDGRIDMSDSDCKNRQDNVEERLNKGDSQCYDGIDNDGDGLTDDYDPGCHDERDNNEGDKTTECQDGVDNDGDNLTDMNDLGCFHAHDPDESGESQFDITQCRDRSDNDGDGKIDMDDPGCSTNRDNLEAS